MLDRDTQMIFEAYKTLKTEDLDMDLGPLVLPAVLLGTYAGAKIIDFVRTHLKRHEAALTELLRMGNASNIIKKYVTEKTPSNEMNVRSVLSTHLKGDDKGVEAVLKLIKELKPEDIKGH